jgi:hypothetical protein
MAAGRNRLHCDETRGGPRHGGLFSWVAEMLYRVRRRVRPEIPGGGTRVVRTPESIKPVFNEDMRHGLTNM